VESLKNEPEKLVSHGCQFVFGGIGDVSTIDYNSAGRRLVQSGQEAEKGCLSAAALSFHDQKLPGGDRQRYVLQNRYLAIVDRICLADIIGFNDSQLALLLPPPPAFSD
jgi:hypothetical protein